MRVIEEDDGSGWVKVVDEDGGRGLVPASYVESADASQTPGPGPGIGSPPGAGQFGEGVSTISDRRGSYCRQFEGCMITTPRAQTSWMFLRAPVSS